MTHGSLCSGIGGFELASAWAGIETLFNCELDPFCRKVLKKNFPESIQYEDLTTTDFGPWRGKISILSAGFPCQPFSLAGLRKGAADDRAIWPSVLRVIREIRPPYFIGENVTGLISLALDEVLASLEDEGYTTETFVLPAAGVGAPHRRDRVWIVAYADGSGGWTEQENYCNCERNSEIRERKRAYRKLPFDGDITIQITPYPNHQRCQECDAPGIAAIPERACRVDTERGITNNAGSPPMPDFRLTESPICGSNDGLSSGLVRNKSKQLKAYGNAIVPQVAYQIFQAITTHALLK